MFRPNPLYKTLSCQRSLTKTLFLTGQCTIHRQESHIKALFPFEQHPHPDQQSNPHTQRQQIHHPVSKMCQQYYHKYTDCGHTVRARLHRCPEAEAGIPRPKRLRCYEGVEPTPKYKRAIPEERMDSKEGMCSSCSVALHEEFNALMRKRAEEMFQESSRYTML